MDDSQCPDGGGAVFDGIEFFSFGDRRAHGRSCRPRASSTRRSRSSTPTITSPLHPFGADAYRVVWQAINDAGSYDSAAVRDALQALEDFPGVSGDITYVGTDGSPANRVIGIYAFEFADDGS